jgi:hypothetical protein
MELSEQKGALCPMEYLLFERQAFAQSSLKGNEIQHRTLCGSVLVFTHAAKEIANKSVY